MLLCRTDERRVSLLLMLLLCRCPCCCSYVHRFRQFALPLARDIEEAARLGLPPPGLPNISLDLIGPTGGDDARGYNLPTSDTEIAAFI